MRRFAPARRYRSGHRRAPALEGLSLSEYCIREMRRAVVVPSAQELRARVAALDPVEPSESPVAVVRALRDAR